MSEVERILLAEQLACYHLQRHDFLNHWQVIMGYIQLRQDDKALEYMREALTGLEAEQQVGQLKHPVVAALFLGLIVKLRQNEIAVKMDISQEMRQVNYWRELWREEYALAIFGYTTECLADFLVHIQKKEGCLTAVVRLYPNGAGFASQALLYESNVPGGLDRVLARKEITLSW